MIKAVVGYEYNGTVHRTKRDAARAKYEGDVSRLFFPCVPGSYYNHCEVRISPQMILAKGEALMQILGDFRREAAE